MSVTGSAPELVRAGGGTVVDAVRVEGVVGERSGAVVVEHDGLLRVGGADAGLPDERRQAEHHAGLQPLGGRRLGQRMAHERQVEAVPEPAGDRHGRRGRRRPRRRRRADRSPARPARTPPAAGRAARRGGGTSAGRSSALGFADDDGPAQLAEVAVADHGRVERDEVAVGDGRVAAGRCHGCSREVIHADVLRRRAWSRPGSPSPP